MLCENDAIGVPQAASITRVDRIVQAACIEVAAEGWRNALIDEKPHPAFPRVARPMPNLRVGFAIKKRRLEGFPWNSKGSLRGGVSLWQNPPASWASGRATRGEKRGEVFRR